MNKAADLLNELRIDRGAPAPASSRRGLWLTLGIGAAALVLAIAAWAVFGRDAGVNVQTAQVVAIGGSGAYASVLDGSGYVVARRIATQLSEDSGKVVAVMIDEVEKVAERDVMVTMY